MRHVRTWWCKRTCERLGCIRVLALRSYVENDAQRPLLEVKANSHVAVR